MHACMAALCHRGGPEHCPAPPADTRTRSDCRGEVGRVRAVRAVRLAERGPRSVGKVTAGLLVRSIEPEERWLEFKVRGARFG